MLSLAVIIAVLLTAALIQEVINSNRLKDLEMKMRHEELKKATRR